MKTRSLALLGALAVASVPALAGLRSSQPVAVTLNADASGSATGSMTTARFSSNTVEYIGCGLRYSSSSTGVFKYGWCQASTSAGVVGFCSVDSSDLLQVVAGLSSNTYITFAWNTAGVCTRIGLSTQSQYIP